MCPAGERARLENPASLSLPQSSARPGGSGCEDRFNGLRVAINDGEQHTRGAFRLPPALLPIPDTRRCKAEPLSKLSLTQTHPCADFPHVHIRNLDDGFLDGDVFAGRPSNRLLHPSDDALSWRFSLFCAFHFLPLRLLLQVL